ncbi:MAG: selenium cofactor biosynthesis protein YqeC [Arenicellales bacterium]|jgi:probable selenium-dependent hydroxylase accessory protein YqeC
MAPSISGRYADLIEILEADGGIVCLVGAGGKKSTIYHLASRFHGRVGITSTVHTPPFRKRLSAQVLVAPEDELRTLVAGAADSATVAYACPSDKRARLAGVSPDLVSDLHESGGFDLTLVKADGARLRWIKAPGPHEPALPKRFSTLIPIVSMRAVGQPLDRTVAHRPGALAELLGAQPGDRITPEHVARMLCDVRGGMKEHERADHVVPVINMVDTDEQRYTARLIAGQVLDRSARIERVVLTRMACENPVVEIVAR